MKSIIQFVFCMQKNNNNNKSFLVSYMVRRLVYFITKAFMKIDVGRS